MFPGSAVTGKPTVTIVADPAKSIGFLRDQIILPGSSELGVPTAHACGTSTSEKACTWISGACKSCVF